MKKFLFLGLFLASVTAFAQQSVNNYKYVVVPKKFDFLKQENQYRVNTFTKFLFDKGGYNVVYEDQKPADLQANPCLGLNAEIVDDSNLFTTKLRVSLENCQGTIVYTSEEGRSKEKDYEDAYQEAIQNAFVSVNGLNYKYEPVANSMQAQIPAQTQTVAVPAVATTSVAVTPPSTPVSAVVEAPAPVQVQSVKIVTGTNSTDAQTLFAQPTATGFQLVDMTPKVVFKITKTTQPNYFLIKDKNGFLYQKDGKWIAEYYEGETLKQETLNIKF
ncbi:hypothetical protein [Joostella sp. CR20]|uniref:hypothetical protein n=1 Tax=Joostella sp. CR20 TaxID=2804312 RepID=UPI00313ED9EF